MRLYCKKCKRHTSNRCFICLTKRSFIDEVQYDLESALKICLQFFTD